MIDTSVYDNKYTTLFNTLFPFVMLVCSLVKMRTESSRTTAPRVTIAWPFDGK
jgi:hypothetical protein